MNIHPKVRKFARELGDELIVGVTSDKLGGDAIHIPEQLRLEGISSNSWVTEAFLINDPINIVIDNLKPDVVVKGKEHQHNFNPERLTESFLSNRSITSRSPFSSLDLRTKI